MNLDDQVSVKSSASKRMAVFPEAVLGGYSINQ
jgi:hypothetical protein